MSGAISPLPNTPSWCGAQLKEAQLYLKMQEARPSEDYDINLHRRENVKSRILSYNDIHCLRKVVLTEFCKFAYSILGHLTVT
jgi:hypothetical protein